MPRVPLMPLMPLASPHPLVRHPNAPPPASTPYPNGESWVGDLRASVHEVQQTNKARILELHEARHRCVIGVSLPSWSSRLAVEDLPSTPLICAKRTLEPAPPVSCLTGAADSAARRSRKCKPTRARPRSTAGTVAAASSSRPPARQAIPAKEGIEPPATSASLRCSHR